MTLHNSRRPKVHRSYRLSPEACDTLNKLKAMTGASETAIVEMAVAFYGVLVDKTLKGGSWLPKPSLPEPEPEPEPEPASFSRFLREFGAELGMSDDFEPEPVPAPEPEPEPKRLPGVEGGREVSRGVSAKRRSRPRRRRRF